MRTVESLAFLSPAESNTGHHLLSCACKVDSVLTGALCVNPPASVHSRASGSERDHAVQFQIGGRRSAVVDENPVRLICLEIPGSASFRSSNAEERRALSLIGLVVNNQFSTNEKLPCPGDCQPEVILFTFGGLEHPFHIDVVKIRVDSRMLVVHQKGRDAPGLPVKTRYSVLKARRRSTSIT